MAGTFAEVLSRLQKDAQGLPADIVEFHRGLLQVQSEIAAAISVPRPGLPPGSFPAHPEDGHHLLTFADLTLDWHQVQGTFREVAACFTRHEEFSGKVPPVLTRDAGLLKEAVQAWYEMSSLPAKVAGDRMQQGTLRTIIHIALKPFLVAHAAAYRAAVDQERWRRGSCPICGGLPDLAYLGKENGARYLVCSRCDMEWLFQRLQCPYCDNVDQNTLAYYTGDVTLYRLYVCEKCRHYLKAIDLRQAKSDMLLPLERIVTLGLDAQAQQEGYTPPGYSAPG